MLKGLGKKTELRRIFSFGCGKGLKMTLRGELSQTRIDITREVFRCRCVVAEYLGSSPAADQPETDGANPLNNRHSTLSTKMLEMRQMISIREAESDGVDNH